MLLDQFNNLLFPNGKTYIQKQLKNPADIRFYSKRQNNVTKPNDHINMNSTIAGSVNAGQMRNKKGCLKNSTCC
jgi:hypothetical protein